jgi:hypothetical protein
LRRILVGTYFAQASPYTDKGIYMKKIFLLLTIAINAPWVMAQSTHGDDIANKSVPEQINEVHVQVYNAGLTEEKCANSWTRVCFRSDIYLNDILVARCAANVGRPSNSLAGDSIYYEKIRYFSLQTPLLTNRSFHPEGIRGEKYSGQRQGPMPYSMFISASNGQMTGISVYAKPHLGRVKGVRSTTGGIRLNLQCAKNLNGWIRQAFKNNGTATITTIDTKVE